MKCPHRLEPHQIQGLDFIHIYPVIQVSSTPLSFFFLPSSLLPSLLVSFPGLQWLVKRAIETREEMGDYIRSFSESQFNKEHSTPKVTLLSPEWVCTEFCLLRMISSRPARMWQLTPSLPSLYVPAMQDTHDVFNFSSLQDTYKPQRRYRKPVSSKSADEETQVHSTLLEYGRSV